jgi:hypothetical protein
MENTIPRRNILSLNVKAEIAINEAMHHVEMTGASERLTKAIMLLSEAKNLVSDYVDEVIEFDTKTPNEPGE